jgi:radical SAM protein with 4Fe4S-binding SPASM domain
MELILKPTELCNFKCSFCSSTKLVEQKSTLLDLDKVYQFLTRFPDTSTIIINGGDPLMVKPSYYWEIIKFLDEKKMPTTLAFTTNLWDFYVRPEKWEELFQHERVGVTTSFNYGNTRLITTDRVFTEDIFWKISDLFEERIGYRPDFISVINEENEDTAIDNVLLAKKMDVECKLNYAMASGEESTPYQLSKIYEIYIEISKLGLTKWEFNTKQMIKRLTGNATMCPQNRDCDATIRCLQPEGDYYSCGAFGDDKKFPINFSQEMNSTEKSFPLRVDPEIAMLKDECLTCEMFSICNGCKKTVSDLKEAKMVPKHCSLMKTLSKTIVELNNG